LALWRAIIWSRLIPYLLGEHGQWLKQRLLEESVRSPLIIAAPGYTRGGVVPGPVEFPDIYPTLAEPARLPATEALQGRSLVPLLHQPETAWPHPAFSQLPQGTSIRTDRWTYNEWGPDGVDGAELYDHGADPLEHHNLATDPAYAPVIKDLKTQLHAVLPPRPVPPHGSRPAWFPKISPGYIPDGGIDE